MSGTHLFFYCRGQFSCSTTTSLLVDDNNLFFSIAFVVLNNGDLHCRGQQPTAQHHIFFSIAVGCSRQWGSPLSTTTNCTTRAADAAEIFIFGHAGVSPHPPPLPPSPAAATTRGGILPRSTAVTAASALPFVRTDGNHVAGSPAITFFFCVFVDPRRHIRLNLHLHHHLSSGRDRPSR